MEKSDNELTLEEYADLYAKRKAEAKILDNELALLNKRIKELMVEEDVTEVHGKTATVKYIVQNRPQFNEEMALKVLSKDEGQSCIKTKQYIDMDALENDMYNERLSEETLRALGDCTKNKEVITLTVSKAKG